MIPGNGWNLPDSNFVSGPLGLFVVFILIAGALALGIFFMRERRIKHDMGEHRRS